MRPGILTRSGFALLATVFGLAAGAGSAQAQGPPSSTMYGVTGAGGAPSDLFTINKATGQPTYIGSTGYISISSLDFAPNGTTLYAIANRGTAQQPASVLISIDRSTGAGTTIGLTGLTNVSGGTTNIPDIAVRSDGLIFGVDGSGSAYTFSPSTGAATVLGSLGLSGFPGGGALAFNGSTLYLSAVITGGANAGTNLYTIDQTTGAATQIANVDFSALPTGTDRLAGMKFDPVSGLLYGTAFVNIDTADTTRIVSGTEGATSLILSVVGDPGVVFEAVAFGAPPIPQIGLFGVTGTGGSQSDLFIVNKTNAQSSYVGYTGWSAISSLDFAPDGKSLYAISNQVDGTGTQTLVSIDPSTGIGVPIGPTGLTNNIPDLAVRPDGVIFGIDTSGVVYTFSRVTGTAAAIGNLGLTGPVAGGALAFSPQGTLYLAGLTGGRTGTSHLYTVDQTTGLATQVANMDFTAVAGADRLAGMKFDPSSGILYGTAIVPGGNGPTSHIMSGTVGGPTLVLADVGDAGIAFEALAIGLIPPATAILPAALPVGTVNVPYLHYLVCSVCQSTPTWAITSGSVPGMTLVVQNDDGLPFYGSGVFSGTPTQAGVFPFTVSASATGPVQDYTMLVTLGPLSIVQSSLPIGTLGVPYSTTLTRNGGVPPNFLWTLGRLSPAWLTINPATGQLTGTPPTSGTFTVDVTVADISGDFATKSFPLTILANPITITTPSLPGAIAGIPYSKTITATGGVLPYAWSLSIPAIDGLSINSTTGVVSGTPLVGGTFSPFTVTVTDANAGKFSFAFTLHALAVGTSILPNGAVGQSYSTALTAFGSTPTTTWSLASGSSLPAGLTLSTAGVIGGSPSVAGQFPFTVTASDTQGSTSKTLSILVTSALVISTTTLPNGAVASPYSAAILGSGGAGGLVFQVTQGSLPAGLILASDGTISGIPTTAGVSNFTVTLKDSLNATVQQALSVTITAAQAPLTISTNSLPPGQLGSVYSSTLAASASSTWSIVTGALPAGLNLNSSTGAITGTPTALGDTTFTVKAQSGQQSAQKQLTISVVSPPSVTVNGLPTSSGPGQQPAATVVLSNTYPLDVTGTLTLTFVSTGGADNPEVRFSNGTRTANFTVPTGSTSGSIGGAPNIAVITGTVAGTITITTTAADSSGAVIPPGTPITIAITPTVPFISSMKVVAIPNGFNVIVTGFSTPRNMVSGQFHFAATTGNTIEPADVTVPLASAFSAWYNNAASTPLGSQFSLTVPFTTQGGASFPLSAVTVTLTNSQGTSNPASASPQ